MSDARGPVAAVVTGTALVFFLVAAWGYDPQRAIQRRPAAAPAKGSTCD